MAEEIYLNVKKYGALGDGVTNDTASVSSAINAIPSGGGSVYFPSGEYLLSSALSVTGKSVYFIGEGQHTKLTFSGTNGIVINNAASSFKLPCGIIRLHLQTTANGVGNGILFTGRDDTSIEPQLTVRDVFITGATNATCWDVGINCTSAAQSVIDNITIRGSTSDNGIQSFGMIFDNISTDVKICNGSTTWVDVGCDIRGGSESVMMYANHFAAVKTGVTTATIAGGHHFVMDHCHVASQVAGVILGTSATQQGPNHSNVTNCFFIRLPSGGAYKAISAFSARCDISGNEITFNEVGQTETGIHVQGQSGVPAQWNMIYNNRIFNMDTAILLGTNSDRAYVINNMGGDNVVTVSNLGTNNTVAGNLL